MEVARDKRYEFAEELRRTADAIERAPGQPTGLHCVIVYQDGGLGIARKWEKGADLLRLAALLQIETNHTLGEAAASLQQWIGKQSGGQ